jgi:signal transduction histidine kinase
MKSFLIPILTLLIFWFFPGCTKKSPTPPDSVIPLSNNILLDSIDKLDSVVNAVKISDNNQARTYASLSLSIALRMNSAEAMARAFLMIGIAYTNQNADSSFIFYTKALRLANLYDLQKIKPKIFYNLSMIYRSVSDIRMTVLFLDSSISLANKVKDYQWLSNTYNALGNLRFDMLDSANAKAMFDSAYFIAIRCKLHKQTGIALASLSKFESDPLKSLEMQHSAIDILKKYPGNEEEVSSILVNIGMQSNVIDTAIKYYKTAIQIARLGNSSEVEIAAYNNLAYCYIDKKEYRSAEDCLKNIAIPLAKRIENYDWLSTLYDSYADVLLEENRIRQAFWFERLALKSRIQADTKQAKEQVRLLSALLDLKNKELRIQAKERELLEKDDKIRSIIFWGSVSLLVSLSILFLVLWGMQRTKLKLQMELLDSAKKLIGVEENMKGRVSMELHDLTTPFYVSMLQQIERAQINDSIIENDLRAKLSKLTTSIRQISHRMNNSFIEQLSITELVNGLCNDLKDTAGVPINYEVSLGDPNLTVEQTIHVYRIVQELLTNAIKYVTFGEINLSLSEEASTLFILYHDTGPGFDFNSSNSKGIGLMNIVERTKMIHGNAVLNSSPGKGTKWIISIPLAPGVSGYPGKT